MQNSFWLTVLMAFLLTGFESSACFAQSQNQINKINNYWDNLDKKYPNLHKTQKVGDIQKPGTIQKAGEIQIPRGIKAITQKSADCSHNFTVGADTLFDFDKSTLNSNAKETLNVLKPMITKLGAHPIKVEGHTDSKGNDPYNQTLSEKRAASVKAWLIENKICPDSAISTEGFGRQRPVDRNTNPDGSDNPVGRAHNRRVEIIVDTCKQISDSSTSSK
ncbi:MAG: OmpA family protein [Candidatus Obscuribacterales bacterium]|nr:OmpA family protein [Candidatus Obscuribacterales bacterium]